MSEHFTPKRCANGIYEFFHSTGLTLLLVPKPGLNITTANITYRVGSRNEGLGVRGATHYLEHGMFKGSKCFNKQKKNGMWKLEEFGAYMNATTYTDRTNYFSVIDSKYLNEVISREADRMYQPLLEAEELKNEMTVVRNEFERGENNDFEVLQKRVMATAFMAHPYHHSTIGWRSEIENVSAEALRKFHDTFYKPSNATYTFCGNFDSEGVMKMVHDQFSKFDEADPTIPTMYTTEPAQMGQRRVMMRRPTNAALMCISFKAPNGLHKDAIVLDVIANIISKGPEALSVKFKEDANSPVHDIIAEWERMRDPFLFSIWGTTNKATEEALKQAEDAIHTITCTLQKISLDKHLARAKTYIKNQWKNEMEGTRQMAMAINEAIARGDPFDVHRRFEILEGVTVADLRRAANEYFRLDRSTVGWLLPGDPPKEIETSTYEPLEGLDFSASDLPQPATQDFKASEKVYTQYSSGKCDIRLSLQLTDNTVKGYIGRNMLSQLMTRGFQIKSGATCSEKQLYEYLSKKNIQRHITPGVDALHVQASIPSSKKVIEAATGLLLREVNNPLLEKGKFEYLKKKWMAELYGSKSNVNATSKVAFRHALFQKGDPNYKFAFDEIINGLNSFEYKDLMDMHAKLKDAPHLATVVGPTGVDKIVNNGEWNRTYVNKLLAAGAKNDVQIPGKSSVVLKYGCTVNGSDALKLAVAVLGNGFTGRLMKIVRDENGLTYGINARVNDLKGCSVFEVTGTFSPALLAKGIEKTEEVIKDWIENDLKEDEIRVQKSESCGSQMVQYDAPGALASAIHYAKIKDGNVESINDHKETIKKITIDEVNKAKEQIKFDKLSVIKVGTF